MKNFGILAALFLSSTMAMAKPAVGDQANRVITLSIPSEDGSDDMVLELARESIVITALDEANDSVSAQRTRVLNETKEVQAAELLSGKISEQYLPDEAITNLPAACEELGGTIEMTDVPTSLVAEGKIQSCAIEQENGDIVWIANVKAQVIKTTLNTEMGIITIQLFSEEKVDASELYGKK